jgi:DNA-binding MarR family transcriptional regulator
LIQTIRSANNTNTSELSIILLGVLIIFNFTDDVSKRIATGLGRLALVLKAKAWKGAVDEGVTPTQGEMLARLSDAPAGLRLNELATQLSVSAPTASDAVSTLVAKALVEKREGKDKRSVILKLTKEGKRLAVRAADWTDFLASAAETLQPQERQDFLVGLVKIIRALQESGDISPQRMCVTCEHFRPFAHNDSANPHHCGFIDMAFGASSLRLNCAEHSEAETPRREENWKLFSEVKTL